MEPEGMAAVFAALDLSTMSTNVTAALVLVVAVGLAFTAYKFVKRVQRVA